jgi:hypothetical protein
MNEFNQISIFNNSYVKVISLNVEVPLRGDDNSFSFTSTNRHLIHLAIDQTEIQKHMVWDEWELTIRRIFWRESKIKKIYQDQFQDWDVCRAIFIFKEYKECTKDEIKSYSFMRSNQTEEILSGDTRFVYSQYRHKLFLSQNHFAHLPWRTYGSSK